jgi:GNAT superfamily N-acetyltransferase
MSGVSVVDVDAGNVSEHGLFCVEKPKHEGYGLKLKWLKKRFSEGLGIKLLHSDTDGALGFIEYIPGEFAWRPVDAEGYMFIHCTYLRRKNDRQRGYGSHLVNECLQEAKKRKMYGVAVATSDGPWMADKRLFMNNGFEIADRAGRFELLVRQLRKGPVPRFRNWEPRLKRLKGWNLIYANQCPWKISSVRVIQETAEERGLRLKVTELKSAEQAQNAPSGYGVFGLIRDGRLLVDHYISQRRFRNILRAELG